LDDAPAVREDHVTFEAAGHRLEGMLAAPPGAFVGAVLCHPHPLYGGTMDVPLIAAVATALQEAGVATLRFNFRGAGRSEGEHDEGTGEREDARAAVAFLAERTGISRLALGGYSFGAVVALAAGADDARVERLAAIAPPVDWLDLSLLGTAAKPKLFVAGDRDPYCPMDALERALAGVAQPRELVRLSGVDHFFFGCEAEVARHVARFVTAGGGDRR
jgi:alpha/beta superfamily hydrolase